MSNRAPLTKRISVLAMTVAAAFTFVASSPVAQAADSKELTALKNALTAIGETLATADAAELAQAVTDAIGNPANTRLKPGNIAGEALKNAGSNAQDGGDEIGAALAAATASNATLAARDAIKRAGTGRTLNVSLVPDFATQFFNTDQGAYDLAKLVLASKPGAGAVIGGRASQAGVNPVTLVNNALLSKRSGGAGLTAAAQDITKFVVAEVDAQSGGAGATADLTLNVAKANVTLAAKVGTGGVAGDPTNGGDIVDTLLNEATLPKLKTGVAAFINAVGKVADIEEISKIAVAVGNQITIPSGKSTAIKLAAANGVVKSLAKAIVAKATTTNDISDRNRIANKQDEIAEVAAYMVAKILNPATLLGTGGGKAQISAKNAGAKIFAIVLSAVNATKSRKVTSAPGAANLYNDTAVDVAGSVAETLGSMLTAATIDQNLHDAIIAFLIKKASAIGGRQNVAAVTAALEGSSPRGFEDGTITGVDLSQLHDPETDNRPF